MTAGKNYQRIYLTTFALIAVLITASIIIIDYIAAEEAHMVEVNDIGGRQRMLSERTVHLLLEYAMENNQEARDQIVKLMEILLQKFDKAHQQLIRASYRTVKWLSFRTVLTIYFSMNRNTSI